MFITITSTITSTTFTLTHISTWRTHVSIRHVRTAGHILWHYHPVLRTRLWQLPRVVRSWNNSTPWWNGVLVLWRRVGTSSWHGSLWSRVLHRSRIPKTLWVRAFSCRKNIQPWPRLCTDLQCQTFQALGILIQTSIECVQPFRSIFHKLFIHFPFPVYKSPHLRSWFSFLCSLYLTTTSSKIIPPPTPNANSNNNHCSYHNNQNKNFN